MPVRILISSLASAGERHPKYIACSCCWAIMLHFFKMCEPQICEPQILIFYAERKVFLIRHAKNFIQCLHKGVSLGTGSSLACTAYMFEQWAYPEFVLFLWDSTKAGRPDFPGCRLQIQGWIFPQLSFLSFEAKILTLFISVKFIFSVFKLLIF